MFSSVFRKFPNMALQAGLALLILLLVAGKGLCGEPDKLFWNMSKLRDTEKVLRKNGLDVREERPDTPERDRTLRLKLNRETMLEKFDAFARLTRGETIPRMVFLCDSPNNSALWDIMPNFPKLRCANLGLDLPFAPKGADLAPLSEMTCLKRLFTPADNLEMLPELPQVQDLVLQGRPMFISLSPALIWARFPNLARLTISNDMPCLDFSMVKTPASLTEFAIWPDTPPAGDYRDVLSAYNLNAAKKIPSIQRINGIPAMEFDPLARLTPAQREEYAALPGYLMAESAFASSSLRKDSGQNVTLRGKIAVYELGAYKNMEYKGNNRNLRAVLVQDPRTCATLVFYSSKIHMIRPNRHVIVGGSDYHVESALYVLDREKEELTKVWVKVTLGRNKTPDPWEIIEELFAKRYRD